MERASKSRGATRSTRRDVTEEVGICVGSPLANAPTVFDLAVGCMLRIWWFRNDGAVTSMLEHW